MRMSDIKLYVIGELLHLANSNPPFLQKRHFYRMKDEVLSKYGQADGFDVQHIVKKCYRCDGTGEEPNLIQHSLGVRWRFETCRRCNGTKIYDEFWVHLVRFTIGERKFHSPVTKYHNSPELTGLKSQHPIIEGYIRHETPKYYLSTEALLWLALFFDRELFALCFGRWGMPMEKFTPMVILSDVYFRVRMIPREIERVWLRLKLFARQVRQYFCWHDFENHGFECLYDECRKCGVYRYQTDPSFDHNETTIPF